MPALLDDYCCSVCLEFMGTEAKRLSPVCSVECGLEYDGLAACTGCGEIYPIGSSCSSCVPDLTAVIDFRVPGRKTMPRLATSRIVANALAIIVAAGALLLALLGSGCAGQTEANEPVEIHTCSPGACPSDVPYCAVLPGGNECRPGCSTDADCETGARCVPLVGEQLVCERWLNKGYGYPYD